MPDQHKKTVFEIKDHLLHWMCTADKFDQVAAESCYSFNFFSAFTIFR